MPFDVFLSALTFVFVGSFTPGPNNTMLLALGVNFGFARTLPHIAGIVIGYDIMYAAVSLGIGGLFAAHPAWFDVLRVLSAIYLVWLAWRIATAAHPASSGGDQADGAPLTFMQAALFQWINPKGVGMALASSANFVRPDHLGQDLPIMLLLIGVMSFASAAAWALFGTVVRSALEDDRRRVLFNRVMAVALLASLWPLFAHGLPVRG